MVKELLIEYKYADYKVVDEPVEGFTVTGKLVASGVWPKQIRPATMSIAELQQRGVWSNKMITSKCVSSGDSSIDTQVWEQTNEEVQKGWLLGTVTAEQMDQVFKGQPRVAPPTFPGNHMSP